MEKAGTIAANRRARHTAVFLVTILIVICLLLCSCNQQHITLTISLTQSDSAIVSGATLDVSAHISGDKSIVISLEKEQPSFEIVQGGEVACINESGQLVISEDARSGDAFTVKVSLGEYSVSKTFSIAPSPAESISLSTTSNTAEAGDVISLSATVYPSAAQSNTVTYEILEGSNIALIDGHTLVISDSANYTDSIRVRAISGGVVSNTCTITIATVQPEGVVLSAASYYVLNGESVTLGAVIIPANCSFTDIKYTLASGANIAVLSGNILNVSESAALGSTVRVKAVLHGKTSNEITVHIDHPPAESIEISADNPLSVFPSETRTITWRILPAAAANGVSNAVVSIVSGAEYAAWDNNTTITVHSDSPVGAEIIMRVTCGSIHQDITFTVAEVRIQDIYLSTASSTLYLGCGESAVFDYSVTPSAFSSLVNLQIIEGAELGRVSGNTFTVGEGVGRGTVKIAAVSRDGSSSNQIIISVRGRYSLIQPVSWSSIATFISDKTLMQTDVALWLKLPSTLMNAGNTTITLPSSVTDVIIEGVYDGSNESCYKDLFLYFPGKRTTDVVFDSLGIICDDGFGGTVVDFGTVSTINLSLLNKNYVRADTPFMASTTGIITDGEWSTDTLLRNIVLRSGMGGYNGNDGGTALSGYVLNISGNGSLTAVAGSGTNGCRGGDGADASAVPENGVTYIAGNGGNGGIGGNSGYAIFAYKLCINTAGTVTGIAGNAGYGGAGGTGGEVTDTSGDFIALPGNAGEKGVDGRTFTAICGTNEFISGSNVHNSIGILSSNTSTQNYTYTELCALLSAYYNINLLYGNSLVNPYQNKTKSNRFTMTQQANAEALLIQLECLYNVLEKLPKNFCLELRRVNDYKVTLYLVNIIKDGGGGTVYGLANSQNTIWFATFGTLTRNIFYSTYLNIMLHEIIHLFHYAMSASVSNTLANTLYSYNYDLKYGTSSSPMRVYGSSDSYDASNSCFVTAYSRKTAMEDVAEMLSLTATLNVKLDYLNPGTAMYSKILIMCKVFDDNFECFADYINPYLFISPRLFLA